MTTYALAYPTPSVDLPALTRAALATVGSAHVTVVTGAGSQALRVPEESLGRVYEAAGLGPDGNELPPPPEGTGDEDAPVSAQSRKSAPGPEEESPGPGASQSPRTTDRPAARPAGRSGGRPGSKRSATQKAATSQRASASKKEGDDQ